MKCESQAAHTARLLLQPSSAYMLRLSCQLLFSEEELK